MAKLLKGRQREYLAFYNAVQKAKETYENMKKEKPQKLKEDITKIADSVIEKWYKTYPNPKSYDRTGAIKTAYKIEIEGLNVSIDMDSSYMESDYHQSNELVFNTVFVEGYHGGSRGTDKLGRESGSIPRWRTPVPYYKYWYYEAPKSFSPYTEINVKAQERFNKYNKEWEEDFDRQIFNPIMRSINALRR